MSPAPTGAGDGEDRLTPPPHPGGDPNADAAASGGPDRRVDAPICDLCGAAMFERHCKILCPVCGYQRDCSDP